MARRLEAEQHRRIQQGLRREVHIKRLATRTRNVFFVIYHLLAGMQQVLDGLPVNFIVDVRAVVQLRRKIAADHINLLAASPANPPPVLSAAVPPPPAAAIGGGAAVNVPVNMDGGEPRRGSYLLENVAAIMEEERGVQPTDAELERFLRELMSVY